MADIPTWGLVPKAQDDSTLIDSAIAAAVAAHNDDPEAHMAAGQSIDVHRTNDVIDHPAGSVVGDKAARVHSVFTDFNGLGGLSVFGNAVAYFGAAQIYTTAVNNNLSILSGGPNVWEPVDWTKEMYLRIVAKVSSITAMKAFIGVGGDDLGDGLAGFGYRIISGALVAYHCVDTGSGMVFTTASITGITLTDWNIYEVFYDPVLHTLTFVINGVQKAQFTSGLPSQADDNAVMLYMKTTAAVAKYLYVSNFKLDVAY